MLTDRWRVLRGMCVW